MARQSTYKSIKPVGRERVRDELHAQRRLHEAHERKAEQLREQAKEENAHRDKALEQLLVLVRADEEGTPVYEFKAGGLTTEPPDAQADLPGAV